MGNYENDISKTIANNTEGELMQVGTKVNEVENTNSTAITSSKTSETSELNPLAEPSATGQKNIISVDEASSIASGNNVYINQDNKLMQIDYDTLATAILNKLSTQSFDSLDTSSKLVLGAINELNGKSIFLINYESIDSYRGGAHFIYGELIKDKGYLFGLEYQYTASNLKYGAQFIISWIDGIKFRKLNSGNWSEWDTLHT